MNSGCKAVKLPFFFSTSSYPTGLSNLAAHVACQASATLWTDRRVQVTGSPFRHAKDGERHTEKVLDKTELSRVQTASMHRAEAEGARGSVGTI